ncbi:MAG TPA: DUF6580 family putative transport protein [Chitinophagaceae bacterium]|nr:DUF6580 family putative transport protein [Chitinophagaceae bacterium]
MKQNKINIILAVGLILMAAAARIVNHELHFWNLAPVAAVGLFGGSVIHDRKLAFLMPLLALFIGDLYIQLFPTNALQRGFYGMEQAFVYGAMVLVTLLGTRMKQPKVAKVLGFSLSSSLVFFAVSNLGAFAGGMWGYDLNGLTTTYVMGIPFFKYTLLGDLIGNAALFGGYYLLQQAAGSRLQSARI